MTREQKRNLANLVLSAGYDGVCEFYGELISDRGEVVGVDYPEWDAAEPVLLAWHRRIIAVAGV